MLLASAARLGARHRRAAGRCDVVAADPVIAEGRWSSGRRELATRAITAARQIKFSAGTGRTEVVITGIQYIGGSRRTVAAADGFAMAALLAAMTLMAILLAMAGRAAA
jgi:hypothetical protein